MVFGDEERRVLAALDGRPRQVRATQLWCAKEAAVKAVGSGLPLPPSDVRVVAESAADSHLRATVLVDGSSPAAVGETRAAQVTAVEDDGFVYALCTVCDAALETDPWGAGGQQ